MLYFEMAGAFTFKIKTDIYVPAAFVFLKCMKTMHTRLGIIS